MKSIKIIDKNSNYSLVDETFLMNSTLTNWNGWLCSIGQINIEIEKNGNVYGGNCKQRIYYKYESTMFKEQFTKSAFIHRCRRRLLSVLLVRNL